jgi:hypothetical protein
MDPAQLLVALLGAGGGGAVLVALVNGLVKWLTGSAGRERSKNTDLLSQRNAAVQERDIANRERDAADTKRRMTAEYASELRRALIEKGIEPDEWPTESVIPKNE